MSDKAEGDPREAECFAALAALSKFSELIVAASSDPEYQRVVANCLRLSLEHGVNLSLKGGGSETEKQNLAQIRQWLGALAQGYAEQGNSQGANIH